MSAEMGPDWRMLQYLEEQEYRATETLALIHRELVLTGKLETESFNELVYLTGVRAKFGDKALGANNGIDRKENRR